LAVPAELMAMLVRHLAAKGLTVDDGGELLFTSPEGGMLRYSNWLRRQWYPAAVAAGLGELVEDESTGRKKYRGIGFHDLRRASATGLVAAGVDVKTAQAVLGHTDARVTLELYAQVVTEQQRKAADAMGAKFLGGSPRGNRGAEAEPAEEATSPENEEEAL
jgi:integrase